MKVVTFKYAGFNGNLHLSFLGSQMGKFGPRKSKLSV